MALVDQHRAAKQEARILAGSVCATIRNAQRSKQSDHFFVWSDFFPDETAPPKQIQCQTADEIRTKMDRWYKTVKA